MGSSESKDHALSVWRVGRGSRLPSGTRQEAYRGLRAHHTYTYLTLANMKSCLAAAPFVLLNFDYDGGEVATAQDILKHSDIKRNPNALV